MKLCVTYKIKLLLNKSINNK